MKFSALSRRPGQLSSAEQMQVQMKHRLSRTRAYVVDGAIAVFNAAFASDFRGDDLAVAEQFGVGVLRFLKADDVFLGNNQHVRRRFGIDVFKGESLVVFVDLL